MRCEDQEHGKITMLQLHVENEKQQNQKLSSNQTSGTALHPYTTTISSIILPHAEKEKEEEKQKPK